MLFSTKQIRKTKLIYRILISGLVFFSFLCTAAFPAAAGMPGNYQLAVTSDTPSRGDVDSALASDPNPILNYKLDLSAPNVIVVESGRGMRLYMKNADQIIAFPEASKIMTAVIAIETLPLDTKITVSKVASGQADANELSLKNGEKYTLEYLLYGLLLKDNDAAAIAIAEQLSGVEEEFVIQMNNKASAYQMTNTVFTNVTGAMDAKQHTTVNDVSRLMRFALTFSKFQDIMETKDIPFFLSTNQTKHIVNNLENAWSLIGTTTGALQSTTGSRYSCVVASSSGGINLITILCTDTRNKMMNDLTTVSDSVFVDYEYSALVNANQLYPKTIQLGTDTISLKFNQTIRYVHPIDVEFIKTSVYEENDVIEYPILPTKAIAKVTFELLDGTKITADLFPAETIYGKSGLYKKILLIYNANKDIAYLILIAALFFVLVLIYHVIKLLIRIVRFMANGFRR